MAGSSRILLDNYLVSFNPTVTLFASGGAVAQSTHKVRGPQPVKAGYANGEVGTFIYTRHVDTFYRVEIQSAGTGAFGSATWRWTDNPNANPIVWNQSGLATQNGTFVALNHGVTWRFTQNGSFTPQFALADRWDFAVTLRYGFQKGLDLTRDQEYRSGTMPASSTIEQRYDMGVAVQPTGFAILDDTIPSNATVNLKAKTSGFTDPPDATFTVPWQSGKRLLLFTPNAYRYWRIGVTLGATALPFLRWSNVFLGSTVTFTRTFRPGYDDAQQWIRGIDLETLRRGPGPRLLEGRTLQLVYGPMDPADQAKLTQVRTYINQPGHTLMRPFIFLLRDDDLTNWSLVHWTSDYIKEHVDQNLYNNPIELTEVVRFAA